MNQSELARQAGCKRDDVSRYARGESLPASYRKLNDIARALNVTASYLIPALDRGSRPDLKAKIAEAAEPEMKLLENGRAFLRVAAEMSVDTAVQIMKLLEGEKTKR